jgi:hypothetical protein
MSLNVAKFLKSKQAGNYQAIIKEIEGRRFLLGFERKNRASRKYKEKLLCPFPVNLDQVVADYEQTKRKLAQEAAQSAGGTALPVDDARPAT